MKITEINLYKKNSIAIILSCTKVLYISSRLILTLNVFWDLEYNSWITKILHTILYKGKKFSFCVSFSHLDTLVFFEKKWIKDFLNLFRNFFSTQTVLSCVIPINTWPKKGNKKDVYIFILKTMLKPLQTRRMWRWCYKF